MQVILPDLRKKILQGIGRTRNRLNNQLSIFNRYFYWHILIDANLFSERSRDTECKAVTPSSNFGSHTIPPICIYNDDTTLWLAMQMYEEKYRHPIVI